MKFGIKPSVTYNRASRACNIVQYDQARVILDLRYSPFQLFLKSWTYRVACSAVVPVGTEYVPDSVQTLSTSKPKAMWLVHTCIRCTSYSHTPHRGPTKMFYPERMSEFSLDHGYNRLTGACLAKFCHRD